MQISALEIYNDGIYDLLVRTTGTRSKPKKADKVHIRDVPTSTNNVEVPGLTKVTVTSVEDVKESIAAARRMRSTNETSMNLSSSRSHCIIQIDLLQGNRISKLHLVDLAGSERIDRSKVGGKRLLETKHINKSLSALGNVFYALERGSQHVPYRDTKLTHFLKQSIGGKAKH